MLLIILSVGSLLLIMWISSLSSIFVMRVVLIERIFKIIECIVVCILFFFLGMGCG